MFHSSISFNNKKNHEFLNNTCKVMYGYKNSLHNKKLDFRTTRKLELFRLAGIVCIAE